MTLQNNVKFPDYLNQAVDDIGDGTGEQNMVGNYSILNGVPTEFRVVAPPGRDYHIYSLSIIIGSISGIRRYGYGASVALLNGIFISLQERDLPSAGGAYQTYLRLLRSDSSGNSLQFQHEWGEIGADQNDDMARRFASDLTGATTPVPTTYFTLDCVKTYGTPLVLRGNREGKLSLLLLDNMGPDGTNLTDHLCIARGLIFPSNVVTEGLAGN